MPSDLIRRMSDADTTRVLTMLSAGPGTPRSLASWRQDQMTALMLGPAAAPAAVMPLSVRTLAVAPGRTAQIGWLSANQFAAKIGTRRQSRGTVARWPELLPELDALIAVGRDEPSSAARWYAQTGFDPVLTIRCLYLDMDSPPTAPSGRYAVRVVTPGELGPWQAEMAAVHRDVFGNHGGMVRRTAGQPGGHWMPALEHHYYREHYQFQVTGLFSQDTLMGYAVIGWSGWHSKRPRMDILELATRQWDTAVAEELLRTTCQLAWSKNVPQVRAVISVHDPYRSYLARIGFEDRWGYVMQAKFLHAQRYVDGIAPNSATAAALGDVHFQLNATGQVSLTLGAGKPIRTVRVQTQPMTLTRLLLQRLEVPAAIREGSLALLDAQAGDEQRLALALPWTPWVFHMLDYI